MTSKTCALVGLAALALGPMLLHVGCSSSSGESGTAGSGGSGPNPDAYPANLCVAAKQAAAGVYCEAVANAWATWASTQDDEARDGAIDAAGAALVTAWEGAESTTASAGADCADAAWPAADAAQAIASGLSDIVSNVNDGLDLQNADQARCGADLASAVGDACASLLAAEGTHIGDLEADADGTQLAQSTEAALAELSSAWGAATSSSCPTNATEESVVEDLQGVVVLCVNNTIVTPGLSADAFTTLEPGPTDYLGRTYEPQCMQGDPYRYFVKRGTVNKLVMYYQGGGACWNNLTCNVPTCRVSPPAELDTAGGGFGDLTNPDNPFRDWHWVFVSYCTCDIHFGDATQDYVGFENITVEHRGYENSRVAERYAREHFLNPEEIFVTGSSAGAYGAWFNAPLHHDVWPASQIHVLADAGNGVITESFLQNEFSNWNFVDNLPDIPGVLESITEGNGMPGYTEAVASFFPETNWAHYSTAYDGSQGGQTGFYNIMLNDGNPLAGATWWEASCAWGEAALSQSVDIFDTVPDNYRYYFGTGSRHTMWGADKVYDDTTGDVPTVTSWLEGMLASGPEGRDSAWENVLCNDCGLLLEGDPRPSPLVAPFTERGTDVVISCD